MHVGYQHLQRVFPECTAVLAFLGAIDPLNPKLRFVRKRPKYKAKQRTSSVKVYLKFFY